MSTLRRVIAVVRLRRLVAAGLFFFCTYVFANNLDPTAQLVIHTDVSDDRERRVNWFDFPMVLGISEDGRQAILVYHSAFSKGGITCVELWDLATTTNRTPHHWGTSEWRTLLDDGGWVVRDAELLHLVSNPSGQEFLRDEAAWAALGQRLGIDWAPKTDSSRRSRDDLCFSLDGQHIAYVTPTGWPATAPWPNELSKATVIEDARTGRRVATLPTVTARVTIAPGSRTAVWSMSPVAHRRSVVYFPLNSDKAIDEQPRFVLWDLETSTARAPLMAAGTCIRSCGIHPRRPLCLCEVPVAAPLVGCGDRKTGRRDHRSAEPEVHGQWPGTCDPVHQPRHALFLGRADRSAAARLGAAASPRGNGFDWRNRIDRRRPLHCA